MVENVFAQICLLPFESDPLMPLWAGLHILRYPGCEKMERELENEEEMERKLRDNEEMERDSLSTFLIL